MKTGNSNGHFGEQLIRENRTDASHSSTAPKINYAEMGGIKVNQNAN